MNNTTVKLEAVLTEDYYKLFFCAHTACYAYHLPRPLRPNAWITICSQCLFWHLLLSFINAIYFLKAPPLNKRRNQNIKTLTSAASFSRKRERSSILTFLFKIVQNTIFKKIICHGILLPTPISDARCLLAKRAFKFSHDVKAAILHGYTKTVYHGHDGVPNQSCASWTLFYVNINCSNKFAGLPAT